MFGEWKSCINLVSVTLLSVGKCYRYKMIEKQSSVRCPNLFIPCEMCVDLYSVYTPISCWIVRKFWGISALSNSFTFKLSCTWMWAKPSKISSNDNEFRIVFVAKCPTFSLSTIEIAAYRLRTKQEPNIKKDFCWGQTVIQWWVYLLI